MSLDSDTSGNGGRCPSPSPQTQRPPAPLQAEVSHPLHATDLRSPTVAHKEFDLASPDCTGDAGSLFKRETSPDRSHTRPKGEKDGSADPHKTRKSRIYYPPPSRPKRCRLMPEFQAIGRQRNRFSATRVPVDPIAEIQHAGPMEYAVTGLAVTRAPSSRFESKLPSRRPHQPVDSKTSPIPRPTSPGSPLNLPLAARTRSRPLAGRDP